MDCSLYKWSAPYTNVAMVLHAILSLDMHVTHVMPRPCL